MIGKLSWEVRSGQDALPVTNGSISIDDQNIPAITASVTVPYDADLIERVDPRSSTVPRVTLVGRYTEWSSLPISAMSERATTAGGTIADLSTLWSGMQISEVSETFGTPLNGASFSDTEPVTMPLDLHVREITYDDFEMRLDLASDEALLTDWAASSAQDILDLIEASEGYDLQLASTWVSLFLRVVLGQSLGDSPYTSDALSQPSTEILNITYGESAYDIFRPALEDTDLKLRVNRTGIGFTLQRPENELLGKQWFSLFTDKEIISAQQVRSRTGDWYDSAALTVDLENGLGFAGYPNGNHSRTYREKFTSGKPNTGMARSIVRRTINRGRFIDIVAPIRLGVFMRDEFTYLPDGATPGEEYQWAVKSVGYDLSSATMRIRGERRY